MVKKYKKRKGTTLKTNNYLPNI